MANEDEPILTSPPTPEVARHVEDYSRFTGLLKWSAVASLIAALIVLLIIG